MREVDQGGQMPPVAVYACDLEDLVHQTQGIPGDRGESHG